MPRAGCPPRRPARGRPWPPSRGGDLGPGGHFSGFQPVFGSASLAGCPLDRGGSSRHVPPEDTRRAIVPQACPRCPGFRPGSTPPAAARAARATAGPLRVGFDGSRRIHDRAVTGCGRQHPHPRQHPGGERVGHRRRAGLSAAHSGRPAGSLRPRVLRHEDRHRVDPVVHEPRAARGERKRDFSADFIGTGFICILRASSIGSGGTTIMTYTFP